jgi:hypothetical protein
MPGLCGEPGPSSDNHPHNVFCKLLKEMSLLPMYTKISVLSLDHAATTLRLLEDNLYIGTLFYNILRHIFR